MNDDLDSTIPPEQTLCAKQACAIQYCLNRFNHQEQYCKSFVKEYNKCREKVRKAAGWPV